MLAAMQLLLEVALKSTLVLGAVSIAAALTRRLSAAERHLLWVGSLFALLLLPLVAGLGPAVRTSATSWLLVTGELPSAPTLVTGAASSAASAGALARPEKSGAAATPGGVGAERSTDKPSRLATFEKDPVSVPPLVVALYAIPALLLLAIFLAATLRTASEVRRLGTIIHPETLALGEAVRRQLGLRRAPSLRTSTADATPWTWGIVQPVVALPGTFARWSRDEQRTALVHELAHVARFDFVTTLTAYLCCALYWFHPLAWWMLREIKRESELACDDAVLAACQTDIRYAEQLLTLARCIHRPRAVRIRGVDMSAPSMVAARITAILDVDRRRKTVSKIKTAAALVLTSAVVAPLATLKSQETVATRAPSPPATAELQAIAARGPSNDAELERLVRWYVESGNQQSAADVLQAAVAKRGPGCGYCLDILRSEGTRPRSKSDREIGAALHTAFDGIAKRAEEQGNGNPLAQIALLCSESGNRSIAGLGLYYLTEAFRMGDLSDGSRMSAVIFLSNTGRLEDAKSLADRIYADRASSLYESDAVKGWVTYLDTMLKRDNFVSTRLSTAVTRTAAPDGLFLPLYKVAPVYPKKARTEKREGSVVVQFTVTSTGRTRDVTVVDSTDSVFDQAAIDAASGFLYAPTLAGGVAVDTPNVRNKISFVLPH